MIESSGIASHYRERHGYPATCAILVASCDAYWDTWEPFFSAFQKYWPDCPYPVYHLSNTLSCEHGRTTPIRVGPDRSWSDNLRCGLQNISEPYVLLMLDDLLIVDYVNTAAVDRAIEWLVSENGVHLRMNALPKPDVPVTEGIGKIMRGAAYRASTVVTVWNRKNLAELLSPGESAWAFEIAGSRRADAVDGFYSTTAELIKVENTIIKRKWRRSSIRKLSRLGVCVDVSHRPVMTRAEEAEIALRIIANRALHRLPAAWRRPIQDWVRRDA